MTTQQYISLFLSIIIGFLCYGLLILKKSLYNHNIKLKEELDNFKIYTRKEIERIRFTEKPICKVGDVYNNHFVVTKVKYSEYENYRSDNLHPSSILHIGYEYELLDLKTSKYHTFPYFCDFNVFLKSNNLKLTKIGK